MVAQRLTLWLQDNLARPRTSQGHLWTYKPQFGTHGWRDKYVDLLISNYIFGVFWFHKIVFLIQLSYFFLVNNYSKTYLKKYTLSNYHLILISETFVGCIALLEIKHFYVIILFTNCSNFKQIYNTACYQHDSLIKYF